jgi:hypothetical protein
MSPKDPGLKWMAGILLISALGLGLAIHHETSPSAPPASDPGPTEQHLNLANGIEPSPTSQSSASAPVSPLTSLLNNRRRHRASAEQGPPNAQLDLNQPAQAAEMPSDTAPPGLPIEPDRSMPKSQATEKGPPGIPISPENLGRDVQPLRANPAPAEPTSPH